MTRGRRARCIAAEAACVAPCAACVPPRTACVAALLAVLAALLASAGTARAHTFEPALLDLREREAGIFDVVWRPPGPESGAQLPGDAPLAPRLPAPCRRIAELGGSDEQSAFRVDCGAARLRGATLAVPGIAGTRVDAIVRVTWNDGSATSGVVHGASEEMTVPDDGGGAALTGAPARAVAARYAALGVEHILAGTDHVLFVVGLFLLVASTRALVATVSAFTVAHSLTLAAAVLGVVHVSPAPIEAMIALSIVFLARELVRPAAAPPTVAQRWPWVIAFTFGLLHGLGFAGALAAVGVPEDQIPLALVAFNVGVELGQLAIVASLVVAVRLLRRVVGRAAVGWAPAYAIGAIASAWTIERIAAFWRG